MNSYPHITIAMYQFAISLLLLGNLATQTGWIFYLGCVAIALNMAAFVMNIVLAFGKGE